MNRHEWLLVTTSGLKAWVVGLTICLSASLVATRAGALNWSPGTVYSGDNVGTHSSLAVDSLGNLHVSYFQSAGEAGYLKYAVKSGASWSFELVSPNSGNHTSLQLFHGAPRLAWYDAWNGDLRYASKSGGSWTEISPDNSGDVGRYASLALTSQGEPRIAYYDNTNKDLKYASYSGGQWTLQTVYGSGGIDAGAHCSLALDSQGTPHIAFLLAPDGQAGILLHTSWNGSTWVTDTVTTTTVDCADIALDSNGVPCVAYKTHSSLDALFVSRSGGAWGTPETVASTGDVGNYVRLVLNGSDQPRVAFMDATNEDMVYAYRNLATWYNETVESYGAVGWDCSLALTDAGDPVVAYYGAQRLRSGTRSGGQWTVSAVDGGDTDVGQYSSIWLDTDRAPWIVHYDATHGDMLTSRLMAGGWATGISADDGDVGKFVTNSGRLGGVSQWATPSYDASNADFVLAGASFTWWTGSPVVLASSGDVGQFAAAGDSSGSLLYTCYDATNGDLMYLAKIGTNPLVTVRLDTTGNVGQFTAMAVASGATHIAYYDVTNANLKYATRSGGSWTTSVVDSGGDVGKYASVAARLSTVGIAYYDATNGDLKYASLSGGSWTLSTVAISGDVGKFCSLMLDSLGDPRISYYDATNGDLRYAARKSGAWSTQLVDGTDDVGQYTSITLGVLSSPRISYYDVTHGDLKYAYADSVPPSSGGGGDDGGGGHEIDPAIELGSANPVASGGALTFSLRLPAAGIVRLELFDLAGRRVAERTAEALAAGRHTLRWMPGRTAPGLYFVSARIDGNPVFRRRIVLSP